MSLSGLKSMFLRDFLRRCDDTLGAAIAVTDSFVGTYTPWPRARTEYGRVLAPIATSRLPLTLAAFVGRI